MNPFLPYGRQCLDEEDILAVVAVLRSDWLTQGPKVAEFEKQFARHVGAVHAVAVNSGTAALHASMHALGIGPGDEVIVPPITFTATANCVVFQGGTPVFADVDAATGLIDPARVAEKISPRTKAIIAVDYAGHPCDYESLQQIADSRGLALVADACHALGATYKGRSVGSLASLNCFSFHPVKHIATGEGGMITTSNGALAGRMRDFRTHGITKDPALFALPGLCPPTAAQGPWYYEMRDLGFNYRISDINCALGLSQLGKLERFVERRRSVARAYSEAFASFRHLRPPRVESWADPSWHLYPVQIDFPALGRSRADVMEALRARGIGTQVHYIPVCLQPFYRERFECRPGDCPAAEAFYARELSLPMYPGLSDQDVARVIEAARDVVG